MVVDCPIPFSSGLSLEAVVTLDFRFHRKSSFFTRSLTAFATEWDLAKTGEYTFLTTIRTLDSIKVRSVPTVLSN